MDEALIENAEHDIDGQDRATDQQPLVGERILEGLGGAGEGCRIAFGMSICSLIALMRVTLSPSERPAAD